LNKRVIVLGWDSADFDLIAPWVSDGYMPNLKEVMDTSKHGRLRSVYPPVTPIAWSTIVTGKNAGKHGISEFASFKANSYQWRFNNASDRKGRDVWELLSDYGKKVAVVGVPITYPVRKINGCMVSGYLTPSESVEYSYPHELKHEIKSKIPGYSVNPYHLFGELSIADKGTYVKYLFETLEKHIEGMLYLAKNKEWDFFMAVFNETDWVQHIFRAAIDKDHPKFNQNRAKRFGNVIRDVYIRLDDALGKLLRIAEDANVLIISDHGAGPLYWNINSNHLLYRAGVLKFKKSPQSALKFILSRLGFSYPLVVGLARVTRLSNRSNDVVHHEENANQELVKNSNNKTRKSGSGLFKLGRKLVRNLLINIDDVDWSNTLAFAPSGQGQIFINREDRFPEGIVKQSEYVHTRQNIMNEILKLKHNNHKVIEQTFTKEELFCGEYIELCPDIQYHPVTGYFPVGGLSHGLRRTFMKSPTNDGSHSMNGILVLKEIGHHPISKDINNAQLVDIVPTILHMMQLPIPSDMDGKSLADAEAKPPEIIPVATSDPTAETRHEYTKEEEADIEEKLRSLGYI
jgi:predicted AlkP superfamily phosphohydrolase/phosphomutase